MQNAKTIIIGGGAIGLSTAYHLGKLGVEDVVLLERNQLTSGTSWHAAGIVGPLRSSKNLTDLARYAIELFATLEQESGQATGYVQTGGLWLAQTADRMIELERIAAMGRMHGLDVESLNAKQTQARFNHLYTDDLVGAIWVEQDGQVNPVDLCMAYAKGARRFGVEIREHAGVNDIEIIDQNATKVTLENGEEIEAGAIINCAGLWAREVGLMAGVDVPLRAVEHIYIVTESLRSLEGLCPIIRDLDNGIYIKGDAGKLVLGTFEQNAKIWDPAAVDKNNSFVEFDEDWEHAEPMLKAGIHRLPAFAELGIARFMNGPESFTPDTRQIMGRAPGLNNFYVAAGFNSIGVMSSAGVGKVMAEWIRDQRSPMDLWEVDICRFQASDNDPGFLDQRIPESVHNQFQMHWPLKQYRTGRDRKQSIWHETLAAQGAVFGAPTGWERPLWFARNPTEKNFEYSYGAQWWWPYAEREALQLMASGMIFELSPFSKLHISGASACASLQRLCSNNIDRDPGSIIYSLMLNQQGGIEAECTVTRLTEQEFLVVSGAATRVKDFHWIQQHLTYGARVQDVTEQFGVLGVMGPNSADLLGSISPQKFDIEHFPFSSSQTINIDGTSVLANRLSYVGEKGWELFIPSEYCSLVLEKLLHGAKDFDIGLAGLLCLDSCRLEKGYMHWGHDIGPDDQIDEAGLSFAVRHNQSFDFIGKGACLSKLQHPPTRRHQLFSVSADAPLMLHDEPIYCDGSWIGRSTSGGIGFRCGLALTMATVNLDKFNPQGNFEIDVAATRLPLNRLDHPPYDPGGQKMKSD